MFHRRLSSSGAPVSTLSRARAAAILASALFFNGAAFAAQTSTWVGTSGSNWSTPANWSPSTTYPNNGNAGISDFNVVINNTGASPTVNVTSSIDGLTIGTGVTLTIAPDIVLNVAGPTMVNNGTVQVDTFTGAAALNFTANTSLTGSGTILLNDYNPFAILSTSAGATLTNNQTISGIGEVDASLINNGVINANFSTGSRILALQTSNMTNNNLMEATNSGILSINGITITQTAAGNITNAGGAVTLTGATILGGKLNGNITMGTNSTISNGAIVNGNLTVTSSSTLSNATIAAGAKVTINAGVVLNCAGPVLTNNGTLQIDTLQSNAALNITANTTLTGTGSVLLNDYAPNARITGAANATLTNDTAQTIHGVGEIDVSTINNGSIIGDFSSQTLAINAPTVNNGLIQATNKGTVQFAAGTVVSNGTLSGGTFRVDSNSTMKFADSVSTNAATILLSGANSTVTGLSTLATNSGNFTLQNGASFTVSGPLTNSGNISLSGAALTIQGNFTQTTGALTGNGTLTAKALFGNISVDSGLVQVAPNGTNSGTSSLTSLAISGATDNWTGHLDIQNNKLIVEAAADKTSVLANLSNQVRFGLTHGAGITSNLPAGYGIAVVDNGALSIPFTSFGGQSVDSNSILISPELLGDANLDGHVDATDLTTILNNFGASTTAWTDGNFDYAATIDLTDLGDVLNNFGQNNPNVSIVASGGSVIAAPEPASLAILGGLTVLLVKRRQRFCK